MTTDQISATVLKPPAAERFHAINISDWMGASETITACTVVPSDPALQIDRVTTPVGLIRWRVRGGVDKQDYLVTVLITTNLERKEPIFIRYRVRQPSIPAS